MKKYVLSLQRAFDVMWEYKICTLQGPIFACPKEGLVNVLDKRVKELQADGLHPVRNNIISREDLRKLYVSPSLRKTTPQSYISRLVFTIGIVTEMRKYALCYLRIG